MAPTSPRPVVDVELSPELKQKVAWYIERTVQSLAAKAGHKVKLICGHSITRAVLKELPGSSLSWTFNTEPLEMDPSRFLYYKENLDITDLVPSDTGVYTCVVTWGSESTVQQNLTLGVFSVEVETDSPTRYIFESEPAPLDCHSVALGKLFSDASRYWLFNGTSTEELPVTKAGNVTTDVIHRVTKAMSGVWECQVMQLSSDRIWATAWYNISVQDPPSAPAKVFRYLQVHWYAAIIIGSTILILAILVSCYSAYRVKQLEEQAKEEFEEEKGGWIDAFLKHGHNGEIDVNNLTPPKEKEKDDDEEDSDDTDNKNENKRSKERNRSKNASGNDDSDVDVATERKDTKDRYRSKAKRRIDFDKVTDNESIYIRKCDNLDEKRKGIDSLLQRHKDQEQENNTTQHRRRLSKRLRKKIIDKYWNEHVQPASRKDAVEWIKTQSSRARARHRRREYLAWFGQMFGLSEQSPEDDRESRSTVTEEEQFGGGATSLKCPDGGDFSQSNSLLQGTPNRSASNFGRGDEAKKSSSVLKTLQTMKRTEDINSEKLSHVGSIWSKLFTRKQKNPLQIADEFDYEYEKYIQNRDISCHNQQSLKKTPCPSDVHLARVTQNRSWLSSLGGFVRRVSSALRPRSRDNRSFPWVDSHVKYSVLPQAEIDDEEFDD